MSGNLKLRPYAIADEERAIELWRRSWQQAYPDIDFTRRLTWFRTRWCKELVPTADITVAEVGGMLAGFVTIDRASAYLDQLVVAPEAWGSRVAAELLAEAKRLSPSGIELHVNTDNSRAIRFYEKHGFLVTATTTNPYSSRPVLAMRWQPDGGPQRTDDR